MRTFLLCCTLIIVPLALGQQNPRPQKVLTPEQQAFQQQARVVDAERERFRAQANQVFAAEMAREKAGDCPTANDTYSFNVCYGKAVEIADQNLKSYEAAIRNLLGLEYPVFPGSPTTGPAGPELTPKQQAAEFDHLEDLWRAYANAGSTAAYHQFDGGTGGASFEMEMHLNLLRNHMRELETIYDTMLNH